MLSSLKPFLLMPSVTPLSPEFCLLVMLAALLFSKHPLHMSVPGLSPWPATFPP